MNNMIRLVTLKQLNALRYADNPIPLPTLCRWCRHNKLPAIRQGREWMVDLDRFDEWIDAKLRQAAHVTDLVAAVLNRMHT